MSGNTEKISALANLLFGIGVGLLAGFGTMLLFAPRAGKTTRAQISQKSVALQGRVTGTFGELVNLSQFDHRKIMFGPGVKAEDGWYE